MSDLHSLTLAGVSLASAKRDIRDHGDSDEATRAVDHIEAAEKLLEMEIERISCDRFHRIN
jgi:hypothetical protein